MRKNHKIIDIPTRPVDYIENTPLSITIADVRHITPHIHSTATEFVFCLKGTVSLVCNHETIILHEGEIFTIYLEDVHCIFSDKENVTLIVQLDLKGVNMPFDVLSQAYIACEDISCKDFQLKHLEQMKYYLLSVAFAYAKSRTPDSDYGITASNVIARHMCEYFDWLSLITKDPPHDNRELVERFRSIYEYCYAHSDEKLSISMLAKKVHISENYFSQFVKKSPYGSFSLMVGYMRCYKAQTLLITTDKSVVEISGECGFSDDKYFYKNFKHWWGTTPTRFREWYSEYTKTDEIIHPFSREKSEQILASYISDYMSDHIFLQ
ncbi:MAG: AraC family transcriptional regulator [Bacillota bacterium]|nr:AraC family transcriptional regulator [Bacillota bacterium]